MYEDPAEAAKTAEAELEKKAAGDPAAVAVADAAATPVPGAVEKNEKKEAAVAAASGIDAAHMDNHKEGYWRGLV